MKKFTLAFLYNVRHKYPDPDNPRTQLEADFDDWETISNLQKHLEKFYNIIPIEADETAYAKLIKNKSKIDLAFNFSEGMYGKDREAHIPAILEMLRIPYTGSAPLAQTLILNKAKAKEILIANKIPTAPFCLIENYETEPDLKYPLILKPNSQGSSAGITSASLVKNKKEFTKQAKYLLDTFHQPALAEPFLSGREFSVAMVGNPPQILPIIEPDHSLLPKKYKAIDSLEVKWYFEEQSEKNHLICPAKIDKKLQDKIEDVCYRTWDALGILDFCRIDIRCDAKGNPNVLEVNSPPGLIPPEISTTSYFPLAARKAGLEYDELIQLIINTALDRYSLI